MTTFDELVENINDHITNERDRGTAFEKIVVAYLKNEPAYKKQFTNVWMLKDVPDKYGIPKKDTGVDIVARNFNGKLTAVQAKFYKDKIGKPTINSFIAETSKKYYSDGIIVSTIDDWGRNAENAITGTTKPIVRIGLSDLRKAHLDWGMFSFDEENDISKKNVKKLRDYQKEAVEKSVKYFDKDKKYNRGKLVMAPGTGKTFTSLKITEALMKDQHKSNFNVLYLVPSIQLLSQTLFNWNSDVSEDINMTSFSVVSDRKASKKGEDGEYDLGARDIGFPATTDVNELMQNYEYVKKYNHDKQLTVVFSTYQSIDVIHQAQEEGYPEFDLIVADEAHRTTGASELNKDSMFTKVHSNTNVKSKLRLYQTATPKIYDQYAKNKAKENSMVVSSMDNTDIYGEEIFRLGFGDAVEQGYLTDYKVVVLAVSKSYMDKEMQQIFSDNDELPSDMPSKIVGVWNAMVKRDGITGEVTGRPMKRAIAFADKIENSKRIAEKFDETVNKYLDTQSSESFKVDVRHVDGGLNALKKKNAIDWLADDNIEKNHARVLTNVKFLTEGIDVPNLDAIIFFSPKKSQVDIVQAVGRIMRRAKNKEFGYIIIPIVVKDGADPSTVLDNDDDYKEVWQILNALRSNDERFNAEISLLPLNKKLPRSVDFHGVDSSPKNSVSEHDASYYLKDKQSEQLELPLYWKKVRNAFFGKVVKKVGTRDYQTTWSESVADMAKSHITKIKNLINNNDNARQAFENFLNNLHYNINNNIGEEQAIEMLAQHLITEPIFDALFSEYSFVNNNAVSRAMNKVVSQFNKFGFDKDQSELNEFYRSIRRDASKIDNAEGKQNLIVHLYEKFFNTGFHDTTEQLGIVFTRLEIVDFIIHSVDDALKTHFGTRLYEKNVKILDPFTGTGTFITRTLEYFRTEIENGKVTFDDILRKYKNDLFANEIVLLSYYIAAINIETTFHEIQKKYGHSKDYNEFNGIVLTDTFEIDEKDDVLDDKLFGENNDRLLNEKKNKITAIISNPPYSAKQSNEDKNYSRNEYPKLDKEIRKAWVVPSAAQNNANIYDSYVRAFRWAQDKIGDSGVIGFITNNSYINATAMDALRKDMSKSFSDIYIVDLKGSSKNEDSKTIKLEGQNVFDIQTGVAIVILVKDDKVKKDANIYYYPLNRMDKKQKLSFLKENKSVFNFLKKFKEIKPDSKGYWINQSHSNFEKLTKLGQKKSKKHVLEDSIFNEYTGGVKTGRDVWATGFNKKSVKEKMSTSVKYYNDNLGDTSKYDEHKNISWTDTIKKKYESGKEVSFKENKIHLIMYRPFVKKYVYFDPFWLDRKYKMDLAFPNAKSENYMISFPNKAGKKMFTSLATNVMTDVNMYSGGSQNVFKYKYLDTPDLFGNTRESNINGELLKRFNLNEDELMYYVYGIIHSKDYLTMYSKDLSREMPRLPNVKNKNKFIEIGKKLFDLHVNYENQPKLDGIKVEFLNDNPSYRVKKMKHPKKGALDTIIYNNDIRITNIPEEAYNYVVNGRSAIGWIIYQYKINVDDSTGIVDDPNEFSDDPKYILNLLLSVITVSMKTLELIDQLPKLEIIDDDK